MRRRAVGAPHAQHSNWVVLRLGSIFPLVGIPCTMIMVNMPGCSAQASPGLPLGAADTAAAVNTTAIQRPSPLHSVSLRQ